MYMLISRQHPTIFSPQQYSHALRADLPAMARSQPLGVTC
jgi:hypothetical protein